MASLIIYFSFTRIRRRQPVAKINLRAGRKITGNLDLRQDIPVSKAK
jgi:hypothetical protein